MPKNIIVTFMLSIISILILGISSYAFYEIKVSGSPVLNTIESKSLKISYQDENIIDLSDILPGAVIIKNFSVKNEGTEAAIYDINLNDLVNELVRKDDLVYSLVSTNGGGTFTEVTFPSNSNTTIVENISINPNVTQEYTLTVKYLNQDTDQSIDMNKLIFATINVYEHY